MAIAFEYLSSLIASYFWPFVRLSSMMMVMVVFGTRMMPTFIRLVFSVAVTAAVVPLLPLQKSSPSSAEAVRGVRVRRLLRPLLFYLMNFLIFLVIKRIYILVIKSFVSI